MIRSRILLILAFLSIFLLSACANSAPRRTFAVIPVKAYLGYAKGQEVRFPLVILIHAGDRISSAASCQLETATAEHLACKLDAIPDLVGPSLTQWYVQVTEALVRPAHVVRILIDGTSYATGDLFVDVHATPEICPLRAGAHVVQATQVHDYVVDLINDGREAVSIVGLQYQIDPLAPGLVLAADSINAKPSQYRVAGPEERRLQPGERRNFRFEFASDLLLDLQPPYYLLKPFIQYRTGTGELGACELPLVSYMPDVPTDRLDELNSRSSDEHE